VFDYTLLLRDGGFVLLAFALAFPIGWERGHGTKSAGFRTLPIVAMAACGFALIIDHETASNAEARARVLQGVITGIGFIGGGAIVKSGVGVKGLVTAASIWNAGAIGVSVGLGSVHLAIILSAVNLISLVILSSIDDQPTGNDEYSGNGRA
jgi:putative Mg2+ transporter-C (MgtC) family protein